MKNNEILFNGSRKGVSSLSAAATAPWPSASYGKHPSPRRIANVYHSGCRSNSTRTKTPLGPAGRATPRAKPSWICPAGWPVFLLAQRRIRQDLYGNGRPEAGIRARFSRIERAAAFLRAGLHLAGQEATSPPILATKAE